MWLASVSVIASYIIQSTKTEVSVRLDVGIMVISGPSWNTDQGVKHSRECLGVKPTRAMKVNGGGSFCAPSTDPDVL